MFFLFSSSFLFFFSYFFFFFFFNDTATTEIYTLSLHDALPTFADLMTQTDSNGSGLSFLAFEERDRKSTRLHSSHVKISYAVLCLKKKKQTKFEKLREILKHPQYNDEKIIIFT